MIPGSPLLISPIHRRSYKKYYAEHAQYLERGKKEIERIWGQPFSELRREVQVQWEMYYWWPPWYFNDAVGFLEIGPWQKDLMGAILLKRKHFPRRSHRYGTGGGTTLKNQEFLYWQEVQKQPIEPGNNVSYLQAAQKIMREARRIIRRRFRTAEIWMPAYDLTCFNMAKAHAQIQERRDNHH